MRATICSRFPAYKAADVDAMNLEQVIDLAADAEQLARAEAEAARRS